MNDTIILIPFNGIGDKIITLIGASVYCYYKKYDLRIVMNENVLFYHFGGMNFYDLSLFDFNDIKVYNERKNITDLESKNIYVFHMQDLTVSMTPFSIYKKLKEEKINVSFEEVSDMFIKISKNIKPSSLITQYIPTGIEKSYGIHLRRTDKIKTNPDIRHEMFPDENSELIDNLLLTIQNIIENEEDISFFITSEDENYKNNFIESIKNIAEIKNKSIKILYIDENIPDNIKSIYNYYSILELFSLSKCKSIIQGVKYSGFSVVGGLIGNGNIINLSKYLKTGSLCIINLWNSVLHINNNKNLNENSYLTLINKYKEMGMFYGDLFIL
jgi:hypothetical protein